MKDSFGDRNVLDLDCNNTNIFVVILYTVLENVTTGQKVVQVTWAIIVTTICKSKITS